MSHSKPKPSIVLVPGSFGLPEHYHLVTTRVASQGYDIHTISLPSVGAKAGPLPQPGTMNDDAAAIAQVIRGLVDQGKEVIVLGHSYGGIPATQSIQGLLKKEGSENAGGVVRLAYLTALVPPQGSSAMDLLANGPQMEFSIDQEGWMRHVDIEAAAATCFSDMPLDEGVAWVRLLTCHSAASFANPLTYAGYNDVPVSYLLCSEDLVIPREVQQKGIDMIVSESGREVDVTVIPTGHIPIASAPELVVDWIVRMAS